ncbi:hypothetical protein [Pseudochelatococcus sp. G4_1912]|uniref:hypothetical protein n=1 Tax=Pseudochelatococcus sp. G4_1912 TaxID=3114288 RepID=UPI0039C6F4E1
MSSNSPVLGEALLVLPEATGKSFGRASSANLEDMRERLSEAHARVLEQAQAGEGAFRVAFALQDSHAESLLSLITSEFTQNLHTTSVATTEQDEGGDAEGDPHCMLALQLQAASLVASGEINGAITLLCALLDWDEARNDALLGLAICAMRLERSDAALTLALDYIKRGGRHPRAHCIIGLCFLKSGDKRLAQTHLAVAARTARVDAAFRDELRAAQRLLIILNFGR